MFVIDLTNEERMQLIKRLGPNIYAQAGRNRDPNYILDNERDDVELHDIRCGRFGLPLKFSKKTIPVKSGSLEKECDNLCLSLNAFTEPYFEIIDQCREYQIVKFKNTFIHPIGCPEGYYRTEYDYISSDDSDACFSIRLFEQRIPIESVESERVVESYCPSGVIMRLTSDDDRFTFRQLSKRMGLTDGNRCLFGLFTNDFIKYSDWDSIDVNNIRGNLNWDTTMNYERVTAASYLASNANGKWTWAVDDVSCIVCADNIPIPLPEFKLKYKLLERELELQVMHQDYLYREEVYDSGFICFALIGRTYKVNLTIFPIDNLIGTFVIENVGMGRYWCTGHNVIKRLYCASEEIIAYGIEFAFQVERKCVTNYCYSTPNDLYQFVQIFEENNQFMIVTESIIGEYDTSHADSGYYTFTVYLSLKLKYDVVIDLDTNLLNLTDHQIQTFYIYLQLQKMLVPNESNGSNEMKIESIRSREFCLHESTLSMDAIIWGLATKDETISPTVLLPCQENSAEVSRTCFSDSHGTSWEEPSSPDCHTFVSETLLEFYVNVSNSNGSGNVLEDMKNLLQENLKILLPLDVFLTSRILQKITCVTFTDFENVLSIFNCVLQVDENFLTISSFFNSTNILLEALDNILLSHIKLNIVDSSEYLKYGNVSIHSPLIETFVLNPTISEVSGIALSRNSSTPDDVDFSNYSLRYIYPNETIADLMTTGNHLVVGSFIPTDLLNILNKINVVMTVFFNGKLFQSNIESPGKAYSTADGKIIAITILGSNDDGSNLEGQIPIFFESNRTDHHSTCAYWSFTSVDGWSFNGCNLRQIIANPFQRVTVCECSHLTHFGCLFNFNVQLVKVHDHALSIITVIGSTFSIFGSCGIFLTAAIFQKWRRKLSSKILVHFSAAVALEMVLMIFVNLDDHLLSAITKNTIACAALGSILHYIVLVTYFWMLVIAYLQFKRYIVVFNFSVSHLLLKSIIFAWVVPLLPVIIALIVNHSSYVPLDVPENLDDYKFCYPTGWALYFGVLAPVALIFFVNSVVYFSVLASLQLALSNSLSMDETNRYQRRLSHLRLSAFLFFTLGLTWIFGLLSKIHPKCYVGFSYLFCSTATIQGLVLFFYFIVLDPSVRRLWLNYFRAHCWS